MKTQTESLWSRLIKAVDKLQDKAISAATPESLITLFLEIDELPIDKSGINIIYQSRGATRPEFWAVEGVVRALDFDAISYRTLAVAAEPKTDFEASHPLIVRAMTSGQCVYLRSHTECIHEGIKGYKCFLVAPMTTKEGRPVGAFVLFSKKNENEFTDEFVEIMSILSSRFVYFLRHNSRRRHNAALQYMQNHLYARNYFRECELIDEFVQGLTAWFEYDNVEILLNHPLDTQSLIRACCVSKSGERNHSIRDFHLEPPLTNYELSHLLGDTLSLIKSAPLVLNSKYKIESHGITLPCLSWFATPMRLNKNVNVGYLILYNQNVESSFDADEDKLLDNLSDAIAMMIGALRADHFREAQREIGESRISNISADISLIDLLCQSTAASLEKLYGVQRLTIFNYHRNDGNLTVVFNNNSKVDEVFAVSANEKWFFRRLISKSELCTEASLYEETGDHSGRASLSSVILDIIFDSKARSGSLCRETLYIQSENDGITYFVTPIRSGSQSIGCFMFPASHIGDFVHQAIDDLADTFGKKLESYENTKRSSMLSEFGRHVALSKYTSIDSLFNTVFSFVKKNIYAENFYIALYKEESDELTFPLALRDGRLWDGVQGLSRLLDRSRIGKTESIILSSNSILHRTRDESKKWYELPGHRGSYCVEASWLGVPIFSNAGVIGVIATYHMEQEFVYTEGDVSFLQQMSNYISNGIASIESNKEALLLTEKENIIRNNISVENIRLVLDRSLLVSFLFISSEEFLKNNLGKVYQIVRMLVISDGGVNSYGILEADGSEIINYYNEYQSIVNKKVEIEEIISLLGKIKKIDLINDIFFKSEEATRASLLNRSKTLKYLDSIGLDVIVEDLVSLYNYREVSHKNRSYDNFSVTITSDPVKLRLAILNKIKTESTSIAQLMLVGPGGAGKTTLAKVLTGSSVNHKQAATTGIDIFEDISNNLGLISGNDPHDLPKVQLWDFAGQTIYHNLHRLFLKESPVYILVVDSRHEQPIEQWLYQIYSANSSIQMPNVFIITNVYENCDYKIDRNRLERQFPFITQQRHKVFFHLNFLDPKEGTLSLLISEIIKTTVSHQKLISKSVKHLEEKLSQQDDLFLGDKEIRNELSEPVTGETYDALQDLVSLGVIVDTSVRSSVYCINSKWLVDTVCKLINSELTKNNNGILSEDEIHSILWGRIGNSINRDHQYYTSNLIKLLKYKKICTELIQSESFLFPDATSNNEPNLPDISGDEYAKIYIEFLSLPINLISSLVSFFLICSRNSIRIIDTEKVWRSGFILYDQKQEIIFIKNQQKSRAEIYFPKSYQNTRRLIETFFDEVSKVLPNPSQPEFDVLLTVDGREENLNSLILNDQLYGRTAGEISMTNNTYNNCKIEANQVQDGSTLITKNKGSEVKVYQDNSQGPEKYDYEAISELVKEALKYSYELSDEAIEGVYKVKFLEGQSENDQPKIKSAWEVIKNTVDLTKKGTDIGKFFIENKESLNAAFTEISKIL